MYCMHFKIVIDKDKIEENRPVKKITRFTTEKWGAFLNSYHLVTDWSPQLIEAGPIAKWNYGNRCAYTLVWQSALTTILFSSEIINHGIL